MTGFALIRSLVRDKRGVAAVEFALIAPLMVGFYLSMTEVCAGFMAQKRMSHVTALVADLVTQEEAVTQENLDGMFAISDAIMSPFSPDTLSQRIRHVTLVDGVARIDWSYNTEGGGEFADTEVTVPDDLIVNGQSIIVSDAIYEFDSPVKYLVPGGLKFKATYYLRPRVVEQITCSDC